MKLVTVIVASLGGAVLIAVATVAVTLHGPAMVWSLPQMGTLMRAHIGMLGALFVGSFGILGFIICVMASLADLSRLRARLIGHSATDSLAASDLWRAVIRRVIALELMTAVFFALYWAMMTRQAPAQAAFNLGWLPWPILGAAAVIVVFGAWLWLDHAIEDVVALSGQGAENLPDAENLEINRAADASFERVAASLMAAKMEILTAQRGSELSDVSLRILSQLRHLTEEQERLSAAIHARNPGAIEMRARPSEGAPPSEQQGDSENRLSARDITTNLEAILSELTGHDSP